MNAKEKLQLLFNYINNHKASMVTIIGLVASIIGILTFVSDVAGPKKEIPYYSGKVDDKFANFIWTNNKRILKLDLQFNKDQSGTIAFKLRPENKDKIIWLSVPHDEVGTEFGFYKNDKEVHLNTRFWDQIHTSGYFKVSRIQGPYQGWYSVTIRGVGLENIE